MEGSGVSPTGVSLRSPHAITGGQSSGRWTSGFCNDDIVGRGCLEMASAEAVSRERYKPCKKCVLDYSLVTYEITAEEKHF
ncbi:hypothetical protein JEQ12_002334 [Ovis aries]|uniref:Uncharacterized protein n=1 Tax=Ovis aries TaxID=9940 RepID=A0A836ABU8_SHEEP|nr:hypothetical protein JEQ12_002334 [Ovis aries]